MEAMQLFSQFSKDEKESVFGALWELVDCPRGGDDFGTTGFLDQSTPFSMKARALLLAASRQSPQFGEAVIPAAPLEEIVQYNPTFDIPEPQVPAFVETASMDLTPHRVLEAMISLAFSEHFIGLSPDERKVPIKELFGLLPLEMKNNIYGKVYEYSNDEHKGGDSWGELHVADDLNVLIEALQEILG